VTVAAMLGQQDDDLADHDGVRLWLRLLTCATMIEKLLRQRLEREFGTTLSRFDVLAALQRRPEGMAMSALSRALLISNGNVTGIVQKLAAEGHVAVERAPHDRRVSVARLTEAGAAHFARLAEAHHRWLDELFGDLPPAARDDLHAGLSRLKCSLSTLAERKP
jgi:DNA-binding MarR family transcriptional regulator